MRSNDCIIMSTRIIAVLLLMIIPVSVSAAIADDIKDGPCPCPRSQIGCAPTALGECTCIPEKWRCDGDNDCGDDSDEVDCDLPACSEEQFTCANKRCVRTPYRCDGDDDCGDSSDEKSCHHANCTEGQFQCSNGQCVQKEWHCDGDDDCGDSSDEDCAFSTCEPAEFQCHDGTCISRSWQCDHDVDCGDASDELHCPLEEVTCKPGQFRCDYLRCISSVFRCDGENNCGDWSDEEGCDQQPDCQHDEFRCHDGLCINDAWKCDGDYDCEDLSDENHCGVSQCTLDQFQCRSGKCIVNFWRCDGDDDCSDNSDEADCDFKQKCPLGQFRCDDGTCIGQKHVCDGQADCVDKSDEAIAANCHVGATCQSAGGIECDHLCLETVSGFRCGCRDGYQLQDDGHSCKDVDECQQESVCSQVCHNQLGSYSCSCVKGYRLRSDGRGCKAIGPSASLLFANHVDIRRLSIDQSKYNLVLSGLENAIALDYHYALGLLFWSDITKDSISRSFLNGTSVQIIAFTGMESAGGLAVDWIGHKIFWTDSGTSRIEVAELNGANRKCIVSKGLEKPRAIVVHPGRSTIYWTDWGSYPRIERSSMDGSERRVVVDTSLFWPNGLTIDYAIDKLFWVDAKHHVIECSDLDGRLRRKVLDRGLPHPFAVTLFEENLYWTDWHTRSIHRVNKYDGNDAHVIHSKLHLPMDVHVLHPQRQPLFKNRCAKSNCSHLCLPRSASYACACPTGFRLLSDGRTCSDRLETFLVFTRRSDVRLVSLDVKDSPDVVIPLKDVNSAVALDWDSDTDYIYWSDVTRDAINRAKWNGSGDQEVVVSTNLESPAGLAVDWVSGKLYWTDAGTDRIEVSNLDGTMRSILIWENLDRPRDIIVDPIGGYLYWTDWGLNPKIERAGMDASQRSVIVGRNLTWPNGLAIDYENEKLYWADAGMKTIEFSNLDGHDRRVLISSQLPHPFGLALHDDRVYWTDWETRSVQSAHKTRGDERIVVQNNLENLMDIHVFHRGRQPVPSMCKVQNGGCSHLCLIAPLPKGHTCSCPTGVNLLEDGRTCAVGMHNFLLFARRTDIRLVSFDVPYFADIVLPVKHLKNAIAIDVDRSKGHIYWSDSVLDSIQRSNLDGSDVRDVVSSGLDTADGLAIDSVGRKLYWTDTGTNRIEVSEMNGQLRRVLVWENLDSPRALTLHYDSGLMFWTDWGYQPRIEKAGMDGSNRLVVLDKDLGWPNGLVIDRPRLMLIWADAKTHLIEMANFNGKNRRVLIRDAAHPYGLTIMGSHIYWTDWETQSVHRASKENGESRDVVCDKLPGLMDIHAVQMDSQEVNKCSSDNGGCSHLCLRSSMPLTGIACACPTGVLLKSDRKTCEDGPQAFLLFASRGSINRISLDTLDNVNVVLPIPDVHNAIALDYHYTHRKIYYTDVFLDVIRRVNIDGSNAETIVKKNLTTADGIVLDWIADNLYWTDTGRNVIEVARLDGTSRLVIVKDGLDEPRALAIYPQKGLLFWSDWGSTPKIERSFLDGGSRQTIISTNLGWPNGLAIDYVTRRLYWADAQLDRIETSDLSGQFRVQLLSMVIHPFGLTQHGPYLYWTDWQTKSIEKVDKDTGKNRVTVQSNIAGLMEIKMVAPDRQQGTNPCAINNGGCPQLCLYRPFGHICSCPDAFSHHSCHEAERNENNLSENELLPFSRDLTGKHVKQIASRCLERDEGSARCRVMHMQFEDQSLFDVYIPMAAALLFILVLVICIWRQFARRKLKLSGVDVTMTSQASNATYQKCNSSAEQPMLPHWRRFLCHNSRDERRRLCVYSDQEKLNNHEGRAFIRKVDNLESEDYQRSSGLLMISRAEMTTIKNNLFAVVTSSCPSSATAAASAISGSSSGDALCSVYSSKCVNDALDMSSSSTQSKETNV